LGYQGDVAMSEFGEKLIELRKESTLSLREICEKAGIPPSRLVELEYGVRIPTPGQIEHLENVYGINSGELADLSQAPENLDW
jgi:transcriptional regulator with XRE-family HTH domain